MTLSSCDLIQKFTYTCSIGIAQWGHGFSHDSTNTSFKASEPITMHNSDHNAIQTGVTHQNDNPYSCHEKKNCLERVELLFMYQVVNVLACWNCSFWHFCIGYIFQHERLLLGSCIWDYNYRWCSHTLRTGLKPLTTAANINITPLLCRQKYNMN